MAAPERRPEMMRAMTAASNMLTQLGVPRDEPVDVFEAIRKLGIWLTFQRLDNLLGATVRSGVGGIVITTERPLNIQRYTAAHELGHWALHDDEYTWDTDETVVGGASSLREQAAQVFAASFLMPRQLVQGTLRRLGIKRGDYVSPLTAYQASRDMGVSYEAVLNQLKSMRVISNADYLAHKSVRPISLKTDLAGGKRPADPNANVWLTAQEDLRRLNVAVGDEVIVDIPENRTTGYRWSAPATLTELNSAAGAGNNATQMELVSDEFTLESGPGAGPAAHTRVGSGGRRRMILRAKTPGEWVLPLALTRSFQPGSPPLDEITVAGRVQPDPARLQARILAGLDAPGMPSAGPGAADA